MIPNLHRAAVVTVAVTACLISTGCGSELQRPLHPGDAVVVAGEHIRIDTVDEAAVVICDLEKPSLAQQGFAVPMSFVRSLAAESLATDVLLEGFADELGIDLAAVRRGVREEAKASVEQVPAALREGAEDRFATEGVRRAVLQIAGAGGDPKADPEEAAVMGRALFAEYRKGVEIARDPRFGEVDLDSFAFTAGNGSLSVDAKADAEAKAAAAAGAPPAGPMDQAAVAALPPEQRCGTVPPS